MARALERNLAIVGALSIAAGVAVYVLRGDGAPSGRVVEHRQVIVDDNYRIKLRAPGPQWELLERAEASAINPGWLASMISADSRLDVMAEAIGDLPLADALKIVNDRLAGYDEVSRTEIEWLGMPALEVSLALTYGDERQHQKLARAFIRQRLLFRVTLSRMTDGPSTWPDVDDIWNAFTITAGTIVPTPLVVAPRFVRGQGWHVDDEGRFVGVASGIVVTPPPGWAIGVDTDGKPTDVEVQLANDALDCTVAYWVDDEPRPTKTIEPGDGTPFTAPVLGQQVAFSKTVASAYVTWFGSARLGDRDLNLEAWCPEQVAEAPGVLAPLWSAVAVLDPAKRAHLSDEGAGDTNRQIEIGAGYVLRRGVFHSHEHDVTWRVPAGDAWRVVADPADDAVAWAIEQRKGLIVELSIDDEVVGGTNVELERSMKNDGYDGLRVVPSSRPAVEGRWDDFGVERKTRAEIVSRPGREPVRVVVSGRVDAMDAAAASIPGWIDAVAVESLEPESVRDGRLIDHRMGFSFVLPERWSFDPERGGTWSDETRRIWQHDDLDWMGVFAVFKPGARPTDREVQFDVRTAVSRLVSEGKAPRPRLTPMTVAGRDGVKLTWREGETPVALAVFERDHIIYTLFAYGEGIALDAVVARFAFVD